MIAAKEKQFTGRHMLAIMIVFFGVIIAVNITLAVFASRSWTGLVVENTYVASQRFNQKMAETRAQAALGLSSLLTFESGRLRYRVNDRDGNGVNLNAVTAKVMHPVDDREDQILVLHREGDGSYLASVAIPDGVWLAEIEADVGLEKPYRETLRVHIVNGSRQ